MSLISHELIEKDTVIQENEPYLASELTLPSYYYQQQATTWLFAGNFFLPKLIWLVCFNRIIYVWLLNMNHEYLVKKFVILKHL